KQAVAVLDPLVEKGGDDATLLALIGTAEVQSGDLVSGRKYLGQAVALDPNDARTRAQLGLTRIALGEQEQGIRDLEQAIEIDPKYDRTEAALVFNYLRAGKYDKAIEAAKKLQERLPETAWTYTLAGIAYLGKRDTAQAQSSFSRALEIKPGDPDASNNLAAIALRSGRDDEARGYLEAVLEHDPSHLRTLLRLAALEAKAGRSRRTLDLLEQAVKAHPGDRKARVLLGRAYLVLGDYVNAMSTVQEALARNRRDPDLLMIVARAQLMAQRPVDALATLRVLTDARPNAIEPYILLSGAYEAMKNWDGMRNALEKVLEIDPGHYPSKVSLARLDIREHHAEAARARLDDLKKDFADRLEVIELEGRLALLEGRPREAITYYRNVYEKRPASGLALGLAVAEWQAGDREAGIATLTDWLKRAPDDLAVRLQLSAYYLTLDRLADARSNLATIVEKAPDNVSAQNDLAWVLLRLDEKEAALTHARRARALAPDNPAVMDTLGLVLLETGEAAGALRLLDQAAERLPANRDIGYHWARALSATGQEAEARGVLRKILSDDAAFSERAGAEALLEKLGG
ncbi:MAG: XrtA/PEP-CTERM system TPR-repeat protein PrsT, partial [Alphaproteobacteria bacterium]